MYLLLNNVRVKREEEKEDNQSTEIKKIKYWLVCDTG
jgi:3-phosphoglycerate kinase